MHALFFSALLLFATSSFASYTYDFVGSSVSTTGESAPDWPSNILKMVVSINHDNTVSATITKNGGSRFNNDIGSMVYLQKDSNGESSSYNLASAFAYNRYSITLVSQKTLDSMGARWQNDVMKLYVRFENSDRSGFATAGPVLIKRSQQPLTGSVKGTIYPSTVRGSAQFQVHSWLGGLGWRSSGHTVSGLTDDVVTVEFKDIDGWDTPANKRVTVTKGGVTNFSATYTEIKKPDLIVENPSVNPSIVTTSENFRISARARNLGNLSSGSTTLRYYRSSDANISTSDVPIGTDSVSSLSAGRSSSESESLRISTPGTYYLGACVDAVSGESNTRNNCSSGVRIVVDSPAVDGQCGTADGKTYPATANSFGGDSFCRVGTPDPRNPVFPQYGKPTQWRCSPQHGGNWSRTCSASRANKPNTAPASPQILNLPASAMVRDTVTVSIRRGNDPDGDNTRIFCDATASNYSDPFSFASGYGASGTTTSVNFIFTAAGNQTGRCTSRDEHGAESASVSFSIRIDPKPEPVDGVCGSANGREYDATASSYAPYTQCFSGTSTDTSFPSPGAPIRWFCAGENGGETSPQCRASRKAVPVENKPPILKSASTLPAQQITAGQAMTFVTEWDDPEKEYILDVKARYRLQRSTHWSAVLVLGHVSGSQYQFLGSIAENILTTPGIYEYEVAASDAKGVSAPRINHTGWILAGTFTVQEAISTPPLFVSGSVSPAQGNPGDPFTFSTIWRDDDDPYIVNARVRYRQTGTTPWNHLSLSYDPQHSGDSTRFVNTNVLNHPGTYEYQFRADASKTASGTGVSAEWSTIQLFTVAESPSKTSPAIRLSNVSGLSSNNSIKVGAQTLSLVFDIQDSDKNLDRLIVDFDKNRTLPNDEITFSLQTGYASLQKTVSFVYPASYLQNCPNLQPNTDPDIIDGTCWRNHVRWKATVTDNQGLSNSIELVLGKDDAIHIYDANLLQAWRSEKEKLRNALIQENTETQNNINELNDKIEKTPTGENIEDALSDYVREIEDQTSDTSISFDTILSYDEPLQEENGNRVTRLINGGLKDWEIKSRLLNPAGYARYLKHPFTFYIDYGTQLAGSDVRENATYPAAVHVEYHNAHLGHGEPLQSAQFIVNNKAHLESVILLLSEYAIIEIEGARSINFFDFCSKKIQDLSFAHEAICWSLEYRKIVQTALDATLKYYAHLPPDQLEILKKTLISFSLDLTPVVGSVKSVSQAIVGKDIITDEKTSRILEVVGVIPYSKFALKAKNAEKIGKTAYILVYEALHRFRIYIRLIKVGKKKPSLGFNPNATASNAPSIYRDTFYNTHPEALEIVRREFIDEVGTLHRGNVHHAIEQQVLKDYSYLGISLGQMHSIENLRGIPPEINNRVHLSEINKEWKNFYKANPPSSKPSLQKFLDKAEEIDNKYGYLFYPPIRLP